MIIKMINKYLVKIFQATLGIKAWNWNFYLKFFPMLEKGSALFEKPVIGRLAKKITYMDNEGKRFSQGHILPLNQKLNYHEKYKNMILPVNLLRNVIKESGYRAAMNTCYCRDSLKCKNYPVDFGCLMLGDAAKHLERRGIAYYISVEKALEHFDRGVEMGLVGMALWIEVEAMGMGVPEEEHHRILELCMCCPCCCIGLRNFKNFGPNIMKRFNSIGWKASPVEGCTGCNKCAKVCPMGAITVNDKSITVSMDKCIGCGLCAANCKYSAIEMLQTEPFRENILDYFTGIRPEVKS